MRALILSGGATKGAYQVGALRRLILDEGTDYDVFCGVSVGALNISCLAQWPSGHTRESFGALEGIWQRVCTEDVYRRWVPFGRLSGLWKQSLYDSSPLRKLVSDNINVDRINSSGKRVRVGAVCLETGEKRFGNEKSYNLIDWIVASASFPVFFSPVEIEGKHWFDGAVRNMTPLGQALEMGATEIDMIVCSDSGLLRKSTLEKKPFHVQVSRAVDIMSDQILRSDLQVTLLKNRLADYDPSYRRVKIRLIQPNNQLADNSLDFNHDRIMAMIERGYEDAARLIVLE